MIIKSKTVGKVHIVSKFNTNKCCSKQRRNKSTHKIGSKQT